VYLREEPGSRRKVAIAFGNLQVPEGNEGGSSLVRSGRETSEGLLSRKSSSSTKGRPGPTLTTRDGAILTPTGYPSLSTT
jgi:hypothetical protein